MSNVFYIVKTDKFNFYKIGICTNLSTRISVMRTGCPYKIKYYYAVNLKNETYARSFEAFFKVLLNKHHKNGEWFFGIEAGNIINKSIKLFDKMYNNANQIYELETEGL